MPILPRRSYLYGASSSPSLVYVLSVDDERVHYQTESELRKHGESAPVRVEQLWIFADLAARGTRTRIDQLSAAHPLPIYEGWLANLRAKLEGSAPEEPIERYTGARVYAVPSSGVNDSAAWSAAEEYGATYQVLREDDQWVFEIKTTTEIAEQIKSDPRFVVCDGPKNQ
jgi:hypothetical protein